MAILIVLCLILLFSVFITLGIIGMVINFIQYLSQQTISSIFIKMLNAIWICVPLLITLIVFATFVSICSGYTFLIEHNQITNPLNLIREILTENGSIKSLINNLIIKTIIIGLIFYRLNFYTRKIKTKLVFIFMALYCYLSIPFDLVYEYKIIPEQVKLEQKAKQEEAIREAEAAFVRTNLQPIYDRLYNTGKGNTFISLPTKQGCIDKTYERTKASCGEATFLCQNISRLEDTKDIRYNCKKNGW
ncbi:hypothetical protein [Anabaena sp. UHCC 0399]|uniref:hypothetical protein n=1 Tax=Anabaena sp. UHCC 0399 TaxID=3110238 RepID=UPI002B1E930F|nr:hypothetical protein [Anabaena sp. UHCC 0399]MEA5566897.1 hypothetical protein [Anabaena sp. UHCC 0399]